MAKTTLKSKVTKTTTAPKKEAEKKVITKEKPEKFSKKALSKEIPLPAYIKEIYAPIYEDMEISQNLDDNRFWTLVTLGYNNKLADSVCDEINYQNSVLQIGATFGKQIEKVATKIGPYGSFDLMDVSKTQIKRCENKFIYPYPKIELLYQDATEAIKGNYDVVICYMLLHEVPDPTKHKIVMNALNAVKVGGKVVFVDYHNPSKWHPLKYFIRLFNRLYQPFAESLWKNEIRSFADNAQNYTWKKTLFFGRTYQKVVATRKK